MIIKGNTKMRKMDEMTIKKWERLYVVLCPLGLIMCAYAQLERSFAAISIGEWLRTMSIKYMLLNVFTIAILFLCFLIITNRVWLSGMLFASAYSMIALVNHYCIVLHGLPFTVRELQNIMTAMRMIGNYRIVIDFKAGCILGLWMLEIGVCLIAKHFEKSVMPKRKLKYILLRNAGFILFGVAVLWFGYFSPHPIKPRVTIGWLWNKAYQDYGYMACQIEVIGNLRDTALVPEGYSEETITQIEIAENPSPKREAPDVILILNETFYDLDLITEPNVDSDYLEGIRALDNAIRGYTVVPTAGGGTNNSEYELLTSNSLYLMPGITPFAAIDMREANSIVSHLNSLGYKTIAAHPGHAFNYYRDVVYPQMGFDEIYFIDDFTEVHYYGERHLVTDASAYQNLISWYEEKQTESPVFLYFLTIQNHGGWEENRAEDDLIHAHTDYGDNDEEVDEFLSCISLSDEAFVKLTEYFSEVDRDVVICMVGDHGPSIAAEIMNDGLEEWERELYLRSTPFVIWANYEIEERDMGFISMNYMASLVLDIAGTAKSPYYQYISDMMERIPVITSYGVVMDKEGIYYDIDEDMPYTQLVGTYLMLEYNNLGRERREELFRAYE